MQDIKRNLSNYNKNKQFNKNTHWTKQQSAKKCKATHSTTINSKPNNENCKVYNYEPF